MCNCFRGVISVAKIKVIVMKNSRLFIWYNWWWYFFSLRNLELNNKVLVMLRLIVIMVLVFCSFSVIYSFDNVLFIKVIYNMLLIICSEK